MHDNLLHQDPYIVLDLQVSLTKQKVKFEH